MKYVALLSGGKDSCFSVMHCAANGHELVAAATLGPAEGKEEIDSYLYQTVGQDAISFVAAAFDVPLYRRVICGTAVNAESEYGSKTSMRLPGPENDETEDLFALLNEVKSKHPEVQAVSVGAILSNYQRVRVEHVCHRLSLTPICYLWQRDQGELFQEMLDCGLEAIIIKVAGIGLTSNHLGKSLREMQPTLVCLNSSYGLHICGEGGEYETLTVDCPLFKRRLEIDETEVVVHSDNDFASVAYLRVKNVRLVDKRPSEVPAVAAIKPPNILSVPLKGYKEQQQNGQIELIGRVSHTLESPFPRVLSAMRLGSWVIISNVHKGQKLNVVSFEDEVRECFASLIEKLKTFNMDPSHCSHIHVFLSSMDLFKEMNTVYGSFFGVGPPARTCVSIKLPMGSRIMLDCIAFEQTPKSPRIPLHVQSLSYWSPANIGPYSQAIIAGGRIFFSGQIGLIPSSLTLPDNTSIALESALSIQHLQRTMKQLQQTFSAVSEALFQAIIIWATDSCSIPSIADTMKRSSLGEDVPTLFIGASSLPRGAMVEVQGMGCYFVPQDDDYSEVSSRVVTTKMDDVSIDSSIVHSQLSTLKDSGDFTLIVTFNGDVAGQLSSLPPFIQSRFQRAVITRFYYCVAQEPSPLDAIGVTGPVTTIPVHFIATQECILWDYAFVIIGTEPTFSG